MFNKGPQVIIQPDLDLKGQSSGQMLHAVVCRDFKSSLHKHHLTRLLNHNHPNVFKALYKSMTQTFRYVLVIRPSPLLFSPEQLRDDIQLVHSA